MEQNWIKNGEWEYVIPDGYTAEVKDNTIIVKPIESEDEKIRKSIIEKIKDYREEFSEDYKVVEQCNKEIAWLEDKKERTEKDFIKFGNLEYERGVKDAFANQWKPTKEQMNVLSDTIGFVTKNVYGENSISSRILESFCDELKQLLMK